MSRQIPKIVVRCPMVKCVYSTVVGDICYCNGRPWIDMRFLGGEVECLDYVNVDDIEDEELIQ